MADEPKRRRVNLLDISQEPTDEDLAGLMKGFAEDVRSKRWPDGPLGKISDGNVFADIGLPNADELLRRAKAGLPAERLEVPAAADRPNRHRELLRCRPP